ncbi:hypothetical protein PVAP13_2NG117809 [Panicum virgatum]|uniref:Uncharacterized protein n=1 Tax=Panicum virgatum TaxID=38727 RepID=A0A8T0VLJ5_PANVG|nr:hypothetical protein PVAP13_2NG117809 [Panicum virgatum]
MTRNPKASASSPIGIAIAEGITPGPCVCVQSKQVSNMAAGGVGDRCVPS